MTFFSFMDVQLNVDAASCTFPDVAYWWFDEMSAALQPRIRQELAPSPATGAAPPGPYSGVIGVERGLRRTGRNVGTAGFAWLRKQLGGELPTVVDLALVEVNERGHTLARALDLFAFYDADKSPGWLTLHGSPYVQAFEGDDPKERRLWLEALFAFADRTNPGFGHISLAHDGQTALEESFPTKGRPFESRYRKYAVNECRQYLRGYSWVTIVAEELLPRLGGVDALRDSGAFTDVRPLAAGGAWLQATDDYREFDDAALTRVFEAVAPVLRPGLPRDLPTMPGKNGYRVVLRDAVELGAQ